MAVAAALGGIGMLPSSTTAAVTRSVAVQNIIVTGGAAQPGPTVTINGVGLGALPRAFPAGTTTCGAYVDNGSWYGTAGLWFQNVTHPWIAGKSDDSGTPSSGACIGLKVASWSDTRVVFQFGGNSYGSFDHWTVDQGDSFTISVNGQTATGTADYSSYTLTTSAANGTISPAGGTYPAGTQLTVTASPAPGYSFGAWSGCDAVNGNTCTVTLTANRTVSATFARVLLALSVATAGSGSGVVTSSPGSINCGGSCSGSFPSGTTVTLTANPSGGSYFAGWSGACSGTAATCTVNVTAASSVTATFVHPTLELVGARLTGTWKMSRLSGAVLLTTKASEPGQLALSFAGRTVTLSVPAGDHVSPIAPPKDLWPGSYVIRATPTVHGLTLDGVSAHLKVPAPPEGVVKRAYASSSKVGRPSASLRRGVKQVWAIFDFAARPKSSLRLTVTWYAPGKLLGTQPAQQHLFVAAAGVTSSRALDSGTWRCVLKAGGKPVSQVTVRIR